MYWLTGFLGLVLAMAPFAFSFSGDPAALWTSLAVGAVLMVSAVLEGMAEDKQTWEYWLMGIAGVSAIMTPFIFGFYGTMAAVLSLVIIGLVVVVAVGARLTQGRSNLGY